jgi:CubicO group peptidase (beta-lactamase class C family)
MTTIEKFPVSGHVADGFEALRDAFTANFTQRGEVGAAVHVTVEGKTVVDLWGGATDAAQTRPWTPDTIVNAWSTTKGWLALAMHMLADQGLLDFDAPVAQYWPEFAQNGKGGVLVRHLLTHTAGLPAPSMKVSQEALFDWDRMVHSLEQSSLFWTPGEKCGYHAATFGWLNGEVLRRITGMSPGQYIRTHIAEPLKANLAIGLNAAEQARAAEIVPPEVISYGVFRLVLAFKERKAPAPFTNPSRPPKLANTRRWREAEIPSSNGHASAGGLARLYTVLALGGDVDGLRLLSEPAVELAGREQVHAKDVVIGRPVRRTLGYLLPDGGPADPRPPTAFGHPGMGGSLGFADPAQRLAVGYVMNRMAFGPDLRAAELMQAVYDCLKKLTTHSSVQL